MTTPPELSVSCPSTGVVELKVESREILERSVRRKGKQNVIDLLIIFVFVLAWHTVSLLTIQEQHAAHLRAAQTSQDSGVRTPLDMRDTPVLL